jgi:Ca2+/Na+ antiporter
MDKRMREHEGFVTSQMQKLSGKDREQAKDLYDYHIEAVRDFQHERQVHLLVTFFFGGLFLVFVGAFVLVAYATIVNLWLALGFLAIGLILLVMVLFYVKHYYKLENGTQRLYLLTKRLYEML